MCWRVSSSVSGGFASPLAAELIHGADLIVGWGCALNMWTMRHGRLIAEGATVIQVDDHEEVIGAHRDGAVGVIGDVRETAARHSPRSARPGPGTAATTSVNGSPARSTHVEHRARRPAADPALSVDSGNFMGYPSMFMSVPDEWGFCFTQAFQSIGLGLSTAVGAALAQPERLPIAALGDGGALMGVAELETVARLGLPMVVDVYNDAAYGAEVHHFAPGGHPLLTVEFPPTDIAGIARGFGFEAVTVRTVDDLAPVTAWVSGDRDKPLLIDAKITSGPSWWLEEAFRGH